MKKEKLPLRFGVITLIVLFAAMSRLTPHPNNFVPIGAVALFGAAYYSKQYLAFVIPIISMWNTGVMFGGCIRRVSQLRLSTVTASNE